MTTFLLLRHAHSSANASGVLAGRLKGVHLSEIGKKQSIEIAGVLKDAEIGRIYSSPLERCIETLEPLVRKKSKRIAKLPLVIEMDYGKWSGRDLKELRRENLWQTIQRHPSQVTFPSGESFQSAARRIERALTALAKKYPKSTLLICSHGDIIKIAVQLTLGGELDKFQRIIIDPASLTTIAWSGKDRAVVSVNNRLTKKSSKKLKPKTLKNRRVVGGGSDV